MLTTHRFNRRRSAEIRAKYRAAQKDRAIREELSRMRQSVIGFDPCTQIQPGETFEQAWARFQAEKIRTHAALECVAEKRSEILPPQPAGMLAQLMRIIRDLPMPKVALWR
jgi:hypothetical protein